MHNCCCWLNAESVRRRILTFAVVIMSMGFPVVAKTQKSADSLPVYLNPNFNYSEFMRMWGNEGIAEAIALSATTRKDLARGAILNWFRYSVNAHGDGSAAWTIFPSGKSTYESDPPEHETESVPLQAALVGTYVRLTGDTSILDERPEGAAGKRTLWQS